MGRLNLSRLLVLVITVSGILAIEDTKDVVEGHQVRLECRFNPNLVASTYYWIRSNREGKDNAAIQDVPLADHYQVDFNPSEGRYDLIIQDAQYSKDDGKFECKLKRKGSGNDVYSKVIKVVVLIPPGEPQITPSKPIAREGESFTLTCSSVGGSPDPMISWSRDGQPLKAVTRPGKSKDVPTSSILTIDPKMEDDLSSFKCVVWNRAVRESDSRQYEKDVVLEVNYIPRVTVGPQNPLQVMEDSTVTMTCNVHAKPEARNVHWVFDGHVVSNAYNHTLTYIRRDDKGKYKCVADNGIGQSGEAEIELQIMYGPKVTVIPRREARDGETINIKCDVDAVPKAHAVRWLKENDPTFMQNGEVLTLRHVTAKNSGNYICQAVNSLSPFGTSKKIDKIGNGTLAVLIEHKPGKTEIFPQNAVAIAGKKFTLTCESSPPGWPEPTYKWWQGDHEGHLLSNKKTLIFNSVELRQEGKYHCKPYNSKGSGTVASIVMKVHEPARILNRLESDVVKSDGESMKEVTCRSVGRPAPVVQWTKNGEPILPSSNFYTIRTTPHKEISGSYTVISTLSWSGSARPHNNVMQMDRGEYACNVDNNLTRPDFSKMIMHIRGSPTVKHRHVRVAFNLNEQATMECHMQAYPMPSFEWRRENEILSSYGLSSRYSTNTTQMPLDVYNGKLIIRSVKERDYGDYTCRAWNEFDSTKTIIRLVKKGPPDTPTALQMVNVSFDQVTLKWVEEFNGGHSNTEFVVSYASPHNGKSDIYDCRRSNPCIVTGLTPQTLYTFSVKAANPAGESEYSDFVSVHTKVNLKSIPEPSDVYFSKESNEVRFRVPVDSSLKLFAKIEVLTGSWEVAKETEPLQSNYMSIKLEETDINDVRVKLCLVHTRKMCGHGQISKTGGQVSPKSDNLPLIYMILIPGAAVLVVIIIVVVICCCRRRGKQSKKDYEMDNQDSRPKAVTGPYYPDTITKSDEHDGDNLKNGIYATNLSGHPGIPNGQLSNGGLHYTDSSHLVSTNSSDNQSDLWIKANGSNEIPNGSYQHYDPSSGYMYPEDYHPLNDDLMNQRNRDPYSPPYYDVSGLPDPYQHDDEDKNPQISFDESLESGYSTPNSRNRRVIREIIV